MADLRTQPPTNQAKGTTKPSLPSEYLNFLGHKVAVIQECDKAGNLVDGNVVYSIFTEGDSSIESQWQTPFENMNLDNKLPSLMAGLQTGVLAQAVGGLAQKVGDLTGFDTGSTQSKANELGSGLEGKSNFNKTNSVQVFMSTNSIKLNLTLVFMAYKDAEKEVEQQFLQLQQWALPKVLAGGGFIQEGEIFGSVIPPFVALTLSGKTYKPFVIESVSAPLGGAIDKDGNRMVITANVSLMSRTAVDANGISVGGISAVG